MVDVVNMTAIYKIVMFCCCLVRRGMGDSDVILFCLHRHHHLNLPQHKHLEIIVLITVEEHKGKVLQFGHKRQQLQNFVSVDSVVLVQCG